MPRAKKATKREEPSTSREARSKKARTASPESNDSDESLTFRPSTSTQGADSSADIKTLSNNLVKYLLNYTAMKYPIKRADISRNLAIPAKLFPEVFKACTNMLKSVYGLEASEILENKTSKGYIIYAAFNSGISALQFPEDLRHEISLLFIILSYIFMKGGEVQEAHLLQYLSQLNIEADEPHPLFGDVGKLIKEKFPRQLYLKRSKVEIEGVNEVQMHVAWGARAELEFDKKEVLKAVAKIMNKSPATFINQYHTAHGEEPEGGQAIELD